MVGAAQILLKSPVLLEEELKAIAGAGLANTTFSLHYQSGSPDALKHALQKLCTDVEEAVKNGCEIVIISDRVEGAEVCTPPSLGSVLQSPGFCFPWGTTRAAVVYPMCYQLDAQLDAQLAQGVMHVQ